MTSGITTERITFRIAGDLPAGKVRKLSTSLSSSVMSCVGLILLFTEWRLLETVAKTSLITGRASRSCWT